MGFIYSLAVVLVIFEGIIIQCEGTGGLGVPSSQRGFADPEVEEQSNRRQDALSTEEVKKIIMENVYDEIRENFVSPGLIFSNDLIKFKTFENHITEIELCSAEGETVQHDVDGDAFLRFTDRKMLEHFFNRFSYEVKKIYIEYGVNYVGNDNIIIQYILEKCANNLEELQIKTHNDEGFWEKFLDGKEIISFPKMKKFQMKGKSSRNVLKLDLLFPNLEILVLFGYVADKNCLFNVKGLNELALGPDSIPEDDFENIFENNRDIRKISLTYPTYATTMRSIANHLQKLETLEVIYPSEIFLIRPKHRPACILPKVNNFKIVFDKMDEVFGIDNLSFEMPKLHKLTLYGHFTDGKRFVNFIQHFEKLETVELLESESNINMVEFMKPTWILSQNKPHKAGVSFLKFSKSCKK